MALMSDSSAGARKSCRENRAFGDNCTCTVVITIYASMQNIGTQAVQELSGEFKARIFQ